MDAADPGVTLNAVYISGARKKALLIVKGAADGSWLGEGEGIGDWRLVSIEAFNATIASHGRNVTLFLFPTPP